MSHGNVSGFWNPFITGVQIVSATTPTSPAEGQQWYDSTLGRVLWHNGTDFLRGVAVEATGRTGVTWTRNTNQAVADSTNVAVTYTTEDFDSDGFGTAGGGTLVVPAGLAGLYVINFRGDYSTTSFTAGEQILSINSLTTNYITALQTRPFICALVALAVGDTVSTIVNQTSGGSRNLNPARFDAYRWLPI